MLLTVFGALILGIFAAMVLPIFVLAAKSGKSHRATLFVTLSVLVIFAGIAANHYFPDWGRVTTGSSTADGWVFLAVTLAIGIVTYFVAWRVRYLDSVRRWLAGPPGAQTDNSSTGG